MEEEPNPIAYMLNKGKPSKDLYNDFDYNAISPASLQLI